MLPQFLAHVAATAASLDTTNTRNLSVLAVVTSNGNVFEATHAIEQGDLHRRRQLQTLVTLGYTSFEEPVITSSKKPVYRDTLPGNVNHWLLPNANENCVKYVSCSTGDDELGFRSYYTNNNGQAAHGGLADANDEIIGVIGDTTTHHVGDNYQGRKAPHGSQYYALEDTRGFVHVQLDPVSVAGYSNLKMSFWLHVENAGRRGGWEASDQIKVWVTDASDTTGGAPKGNETVLLDATGQNFPKMIQLDQWKLWTKALLGYNNSSTISMVFGVQASDANEEAWFDYFKVEGTGPPTSSDPFACGFLECPNGTARTVIQGNSSCSACPAGTADSDFNPKTPCEKCPPGRFMDAAGSTQCKPLRLLGYTSFEEPKRTGFLKEAYQWRGSTHYRNILPLYHDTQGSVRNHELKNNFNEPLVEYAVCRAGQAELGFRSYFTKNHYTGESRPKHLIGVVGDSSTEMKGAGSWRQRSNQAGKAPHGSQYYILENTLGFVHVTVDPVPVGGYTQIFMAAWVYVSGSTWGLWDYKDHIKVWATVTDGGSTTTTVLLEGNDMDDANTGEKHNPILTGMSQHKTSQWIEYNQRLADPKNVDAVASMAFGMTSNKDDKEVWFDYLRIYGDGVSRGTTYNCNITACPNGTEFTIANATSLGCSACAPGKEDADTNPTTRCSDCTPGRFASVAGQSSCANTCPGFPTRGFALAGASSLDDCSYIIGYTSFEEPQTVVAGRIAIPLQDLGEHGCNPGSRCDKCQGDCDRDTDCKDGLKCGQRHNYENVTGCLPGGTRGRDYCYIPPIPFYVDTIGGHKDHALISNPDQNPVTYTMCARGKLELGFRSFYINTHQASETGGLADGDILGVVGDTSTAHAVSHAVSGNGKKAPHGHQYFALEDTHGWLYVEMDPVPLKGYRNPTMVAWAHVNRAGWKGDKIIKIWATDAVKRTEKVLLDGPVLTLSRASAFRWGEWTKHTAKLDGFTSAIMAFGLRSNHHDESAWFDYFQIRGTGPESNEQADFCSRNKCQPGTVQSTLTNGTKTYVKCGACPAGKADEDSDPSTICATCVSGQFASDSGLTSCNKTRCPVGSYSPPGATADVTDCQLCATGKADDDQLSTTACVDCPAGKFASRQGALKCEECPGFPGALGPVASTTASNCIYIIGFTSFEEPVTLLQGVLYQDISKNYSKDYAHQLTNNIGQNPVEYTACLTPGSAELGFRSYYSNTEKSVVFAGLQRTGSVFGVLSETMDTGRWGVALKKAPHGTQYFVMTNTASDRTSGFAYVEMDPVDVSSYTNITMSCYVYRQGSRWMADQDANYLKVWVSERPLGQTSSPVRRKSLTGKEVMVAQSGPFPPSTSVYGDTRYTKGGYVWTQHTASLDGFTATAVMSFGSRVQSDRWNQREAWFDYFQIRGNGPVRTAQSVCGNGTSVCRSGEQRLFGMRGCKLCPPGRASNQGQPCTVCPEGTFAAGSGSTSCTPCSAGTHALSGAVKCTACSSLHICAAGFFCKSNIGEDGHCVRCTAQLCGCTDSLATSYDPAAKHDDGSCQYSRSSGWVQQTKKHYSDAYTYLGCYVDDRNRDLNINKGSLGANTPSGRPNECAQKCSGYKFMGLQSDSSCFCDNHYASGQQYKKQLDTVCDTDGKIGAWPAFADKCGTSNSAKPIWTNAVYALAGPYTTVPPLIPLRGPAKNYARFDLDGPITVPAGSNRFFREVKLPNVRIDSSRVSIAKGLFSRLKKGGFENRALDARDSQITLVNVNFHGNQHAVYVVSSNLSMTLSSVSHNVLNSHLIGGVHSFTQSSFDNNGYEGSSGGLGGALSIRDASLQVVSSAFRCNLKGSGGTIYAKDSSLSFTLTTISQGRGSGYGAAIYMEGGSLRMLRSEISTIAGADKGTVYVARREYRGYYYPPVSASLINCTFSDNIAANGAGVMIKGGSLTAADCNFTNNRADKLADHLLLDDMRFIRISTTRFTPFADGESRSVGIRGIMADCSQHPCKLGQGCQYSAYSLSCKPCRPGLVGLDGKACTTCMPGFGPAQNQTICTACRAGRASTFGVCQDCLEGFEPSRSKTVCADVDECADPLLHDCDALRGTQQGVAPCVNTKGSYTCSRCPSGFRNGQPPLNHTHACVKIVVDTSTGAAIQLTTNLKLKCDPAALVPNSPAQTALKKALIADFALALGQPASDFEIKSLQPSATGRRRRTQSQVEVNVEIVLKSDSAAVVFKELQSQLSDPASKLMTGQITGKLTKGQAPTMGTSCPAGTEPSSDQSQCNRCSGNSASADGRICAACPAGQTPTLTHSSCNCAPHWYNRSQGAIKCYETSSEEYSEEDFAAMSSDTCVSCANLPCVDCSGNTRISAQYKLAYATSAVRAVFRCPLGATTCLNDACTEGYEGPLCNNCKEGYARSGLQGPCTECVGDLNWPLAICGGVFIFAVVVAVLFVVSKTHSTQKTYVSLSLTLGKIATGMAQILVASAAVFQIHLPDMFSWLTNSLKFFAMDLFGFLRLGCVSSYRYADKLILAFILPLVLVGCVILVYFLRRDAVENMESRAIKMAAAAIFLVYTFISQTMFEAFGCRDLGGESFLAVDFQTSCDTSQYNLLVGFGVLGVFVYPIAIPAGTIFVLYQNKAEITERGSEKFDRFSFLVADYKPQFWFWESVEMFRKVCLTGLISVFRRGSLFQLVIGAFLSMLSLAASAFFQPYEDHIANVFKVTTELSILATLVLCILLKISAEDLEKEGLDYDFVDVCLCVQTVVLPVVGLVLAFSLIGFELRGELARHSPRATATTGEVMHNPLDDLSAQEDGSGEEDGGGGGGGGSGGGGGDDNDNDAAVLPLGDSHKPASAFT